jgi:hypothetical protein
LIYRNCQTGVFLEKENSLIGKRVTVNFPVAKQQVRARQLAAR